MIQGAAKVEERRQELLRAEELRSVDALETAGSLRRESHFFHRIVQPGRWLGDATGRLHPGMNPAVGQVANLLQGFSPDGRVRLAADAGDEGRLQGWSVRFGIPDSLNALWALSPKQGRTSIEKALWSATGETLSSLQVGIRLDIDRPERFDHSSLAIAAFQQRTSPQGRPRRVGPGWRLSQFCST